MAPIDVQDVVKYQFGSEYVGVVDPRLAAPVMLTPKAQSYSGG